MATKTSTTSGNWSDGSTWVGGVAPVDDDSVVIAAGHSVLMNADLSAYTGIRTVTIQGGSTPAMLYWKNGTSGYLKLRSGYSIVGTTGTNKGRLLANADGVWGNTGALSYAYKATIQLNGSSKITATYLDIALHADHPVTKYVEVYKTAYGPVSQTTNITPNDDYIDIGVTPPIVGTVVKFKTTGTLPTGMHESEFYFIRTISGTKIQIAYTNANARILNLTDTGSGNLTMYDGHTDITTKTVNVIQDVTSDTPWSTTAGFNRVTLINISTTDANTMVDTLATITASTMTLTTNVINAIKYPLARLYLISRNVQIQGTTSSTTQYLVDYTSSSTHGGIFDCELSSTYSLTTRSLRGIYGGIGHIFSGIIGGCSYGIVSATLCTLSGISVTNGYFAYSVSNSTFTGDIGGGSSYAILSGSNNTVYSDIFGCEYAIGTTSSVVYSNIFGCTYGVGGTVGGPYETTIYGTIRNCDRGGYTAVGAIFRGEIRACTYGLYGVTNCQHYGLITECTYATSNCTGCLIAGVLTRCSNYAVNAAFACIVSADISYFTYGIYGGDGTILNATFSNNTTDISLAGGVWRGYNVALNSTIQVTAYKYTDFPAKYPAELTIHRLGNIDGALGSWCPGGYIKTNITGKHVMTVQHNTGHTYLFVPLKLIANTPLTISINAQLSGITTWTDLPSFSLRDPSVAWEDAAELLTTVTQINNTDEQEHTLTYTSETDKDVVFMVKAKGGNTTGTGTETCSFSYGFSMGTNPVLALASID